MRARSIGLSLLLLLLPLAVAQSQRTDRSVVHTLTRSLSERVSRPIEVRVVDSARSPLPQETASTLILHGMTVSGHSQPPMPRPRFDSLAQRFYGSDARMETMVAINPTLAMVWLSRDSSTSTAPDELPFRVFGSDPASGRTVSLVPVVDRRARLRYHASEARYRGEVVVGFRDSLNPAGVVTLGRPLVIGVGGTVESVDPTRLEIRRINEVDTRVQVSSVSRPRDPVLILHPDFTDRAVHIPLQVTLDSLIVSAPRAMRGLGTQEEEIVVSVPRGTLAPGDSVEVTLSADKGKLTPSRVVYVRQNFSARVRLRSAGLGTEALRLESGFMAADVVSIQYTLPWVLLVIALVGAVLGTLLRWWKARVKDPGARIPWPRIAMALLVVAALSVGLEKAGLGYALGFSEVGTFVMAAIFAGGTAVLRWKEA